MKDNPYIHNHNNLTYPCPYNSTYPCEACVFEETLKAVGEWLSRQIVRDLDGERVDCQTRFPSSQDILILLRGEMPEEKK